jgi:short-subunit dehydrogenase
MGNTKSIFITGAASGIGKATAKHFHQLGYFVGFFDLNENALKEVEQEVGEERACYKVCDVRSDESVQQALDYFSTFTNGQLDILHNNAGVLFEEAFEKEEWRKHQLTVDVNITGVMRVAYLAFPLLKTTPNSLLINTSSVSSIYGIPRLAIYSSSKAFVKSFTEALSLEWKEQGIDVVSVMPPFVKTPMLDVITSGLTERMGVDLQPEDVARFIGKVSKQRKLHNPVGWKTAVSARMLGLMNASTQEKIMHALTKSS